jgi:pSer/pThr/pTyr-binding forkhead associated (FHA) protein
MEVLDPIEQVVKAVVNLGIATPEAMAAHATAWRERPPSEDTSDDEMELAGFLTMLHQADVLSRTQGRTLLMMLSGRGAAPPDDPYLGRKFGEYIAEAKVGEGGMGKVYRATRVGSLENDFVLKVFASTQDEAGLARFQRECEVMSSLDHPNIVRVFGAGHEGNLPYLVLEYVEGPTLQELIDQRGKFSWLSATRAIKQITSALAAAHETGSIHRDVKPSNVLVARGGILKVFDFGLAKTVDSCKVSQAGEILGSPAYMAPEQWGDHEVDHRVDLFALGVVYYLMLTGTTPFRGNTPADFSWKIQAGSYEPVETYAPDVPLGVRAVVSQLLERDRNFRPPTASALLADLDRLTRDQFPSVPRLEGAGAEERFVLVGRQEFDVGTHERCAVRVHSPSVAERHARLERTLGGILLRDLGSGLGVEVNGKRVREIVLRDRDVVRLGEGGAELRFRAGNLSGRTSARFASDRLKQSSDEHQPLGDRDETPLVVPGLLAAALVDAGHQAALLCCFEALDPATALDAIAASRQRLERIGVSSDDAERIAERARVSSQERVWRIADGLFKSTHENLGRSVEAWLAWWFEARAQLVRQVRPPGPRATGQLSITMPDASVSVLSVVLDDRETWTLGRADDADVTIKERSVSRRHVHMARLITRYAFLDLGSRFGTTIDGSRHDVGLLAHGDVLGLGRTRALFEDALNDHEATEAGMVEIDPSTFQALVELRAPNTLRALIRLLDRDALREGLAAQAAGLPEPEEASAAVENFLSAQRALALDALPAIAQANHGLEAAAWQAWLDGLERELPPQVEPTGWSLG